MLIRGSKGGGGKGGGGGSTRVAVEDPDSLRSRQNVRVIDLLSEGECGGLVNGLQSVFFDETPVQNKDGSTNFQGVFIDTRLGTQSQTHIAGFPSVEAETAVNVEVKKEAPVVRTITDSDIDAVRVTLSIPSLQSQNTTNADIKGTSVQIAIDVQSNGGGFVTHTLSPYSFALSFTGNSISSINQIIRTASIEVNWVGSATKSYQSCTWTLYYSRVGVNSWTPFAQGESRGTPIRTRVGRTSRFSPASQSKAIQFSVGIEDKYEFRVVKTGGEGTLSIAGTGNGWAGLDTITGKTSSRYQRAYRVELKGQAPWDIRVRRITLDSNTSALQNKTYWDSYTEIVDTKFTYPNSAIVAISTDASRFSNIPTRAYDWYGIKIKIPSNYDPLTRIYTGVWDGTFKTAWSDNPAWVFYDAITNNRYGVGEFIGEGLTDKWALYTIGRYCDEFVDTGLGGKEPRFTCNLYLQTAEEAYNVLQAIASSFRSMSYWAGGAITAVQDSPKQPVALFTPANVINGEFNYSGSSAKTRHTVSLVTWNDLDDMGKQAVEYVADEESILRYGVVQTEVVAVGCTSRGQAHRFGRALLFSEQMETETITFRAGLDSLSLTVGDIIQTSNPTRAGERLGGRIQQATLNTITVDSDVNFSSGSGYVLWVVLPDGKVESRSVINPVEVSREIVVSQDFTQLPINQAIWVLGSTSINPETWRVISIAETEEVNAEITALEYRSDKYLAIEQELRLEPIPISNINVNQETPINLKATESLYLISSSLVATSIAVSWEGKAEYYEVQWKSENSNWTTLSSRSNSVDIRPVVAGRYEIKVTGLNSLGKRSQTISLNITIYGLTVPPLRVENFQLASLSGSAHLTWSPSKDLDVVVGGHIRIRHTPEKASPSWSSAIDIGGTIGGSTNSAVLPLLAGSYLAKWVDSSGNQSEVETIITTNAPNVINMNAVEVLNEVGFTGNRNNVSIISGRLTLDSGETIDERLDPIDEWPRLSSLGEISPIGTYLFAQSIDLGSVQTSRLTASIAVFGVDEKDLLDERIEVDTWPNVDGDLIDDVDAILYVRTSDDNTDFSEWEEFVVGEYEARSFEFKLELVTYYPTHNIRVTSLEVVIDMPDRLSSGDDIESGLGIKSVAFPVKFMVTPAIGITAQNMFTGDYYEITNKTVQGFDITFKDASGANISRTFDHIERGY